MLAIQILIVAFVLFAVVAAAGQFRKGRLPLGWLLFWFVFWTAVGVVAVQPGFTDMIANRVGVGRGADLAIYLSVITLFYLVFRLFVKIEGLERDITKLVRSRALEHLDTE
jgi:hypothetical protein